MEGETQNQGKLPKRERAKREPLQVTLTLQELDILDRLGEPDGTNRPDVVRSLVHFGERVRLQIQMEQTSNGKPTELSIRLMSLFPFTVSALSEEPQENK